ncbi:MAG: puromycin-sensitive aminopeptidase [Patescibacteria group bacterium]|nr:puromycin-sensitive aminopeptidase [Patescibacteria group bacterium]
MKSQKISKVRLSKDVTPIKYNIEIKPDLENFTFEGIETISIKLNKPTNKLTLHSKEIQIETASVLSKKDKIFSKKISYDEERETVEFTFPKIIDKGSISLTIVFKGILNDKMRGFYRSKYTIDNTVHHMATTQFEATDARRAFPCFDEPAQKAIFNVSLIVRKGKTAISNTLPVSVDEHEGEYEIIKFSPTPKMSTYLLAFIVGDFENIESKTKNGTQVRVFTTPGKKHQAKFALSCAIKTLEFYEEYFDIPYPLPVLDMIAIPDFSSGAMENWGAITYRESALLVDEEHSSASNKQWVALVIAHELAHQWFGNLVTMEWWTHLWLNEGFASYIEYLAVDKMFPKWDIWTQFSTADLGVALRLDGLLNTHPIEIPVNHPGEIGEIFDEVSYSKGASIIRMLASYLGEKDFRDGLRYYLKKHSYKNTETIHLWQAFEKISKKPVSKMMHNWTSRPGYPVIKAQFKNEKLKLSQERFFSSPISKTKTKDKTIWQIPEKNLVTKNWIKINFGEEGFYRTAYTRDMLEMLKEPVSSKKLSPRDRLGIIRDLFALGEAGVIPTTDALSFLSAYENEDNYTVWLEIATGLAKLEQILSKNKTAGANLNKLIISLFSPSIKRLGWEAKSGEAHADALLRSLVISRLGRSGDKKTITFARDLFKAMQKGEQIHPDIRGAIYGIVATHGGMKEYKALIKKYKAETLHEEKNRIGSALGDFRDDKILCLSMHFALSNEVRIQDTIGIFSGIGANPLGRNIWLKSLKQNWKMLVTRYGDGGMALGRMVKAIGGSAEKKHLDEFKKFFATHDAPGAKRSVDQVTERLESNVAWLTRDGKAIEKFLK